MRLDPDPTLEKYKKIKMRFTQLQTFRERM